MLLHGTVLSFWRQKAISLLCYKYTRDCKKLAGQLIMLQATLKSLSHHLGSRCLPRTMFALIIYSSLEEKRPRKRLLS